MFAAYGGFLLLNADDKVLAVQAIAPESGDGAVGVSFSQPKQWRSSFAQQLQSANRFQPVTLPFMLEAGAREFCWINPEEQLTLEKETWTPSTDGAFLYLMASGESLYFPADLHSQHSRAARAAVKI